MGSTQRLPIAAYCALENEAFSEENGHETRLTVALAWVLAKKARNRIIGQDLFIDPAWDILLDLYISKLRGRQTSVSDVCLAVDAPTTTAWRWITVLEDRGLVLRTKDDLDRRRSFISLSDEGFEKIELALDAASASDRKLGIGRLRFPTTSVANAGRTS